MRAPTLLIGLGGTGCKIINKVASLVTPEERKKLSLVAFDTDINELRDIKKNNPDVKIIQTSTKSTVGKYLDVETHARDTWFPVNGILNDKTLSEGAGQVRATSRLAFESVVRDGRKLNALHEAIDNLFKNEEEKEDQVIRVTMVGSVAGGTGAGLILPVAMYVRNYLRQRFSATEAIVRGFFILPEVFYKVIKGEQERHNLRANAYASLRELDAFLMKGDKRLHKKYCDKVVMEFPHSGGDGFESYDVRPYDYCFLFDATDADGGGSLNSFNDYLNHAANCIYAQSIGPMNKRSNSSEDNTIRKIASGKGRNRYAGAGASLMIYPFEDIKRYIALKWTKERISEKWLMFDDAYEEYCRSTRRREEQGIHVSERTPSEYYVQAVEEDAKNKKPFARALINQCSTFEANGITKLSDKWDTYIGAIENRLGEASSENLEDIEEQQRKIEKAFNGLKGDSKKYSQLREELDLLYSMNQKYSEENAPVLAFTLFNYNHQYDKNSPVQEHELEFYLKNNGKYMHPNAIRYFLIKVKNLMEASLRDAESQLTDAKEYLNDFDEKELKFDPNAKKGDKSQISALNRKKSFFEQLSNKATEEQNALAQKFRAFYQRATDFREYSMRYEVYQEGLNYINNLIESFEMFYNSFRTKLSEVDTELLNIERKYAKRPGQTIRYVNADKVCLQKTLEKNMFTGGTSSLDSGLSQNIYQKVKNYAVMSEKPANNSYFNELFENQILKFYEDEVMREHASQIDIDIIDALRLEAINLNPQYLEEMNVDELVDRYCKEAIVNTRGLSTPYIEKPTGDSFDPLYACAINKDTYDTALDKDPRKRTLIDEAIMDLGGIGDDDVPKNLIMFYQAFYGIRANDLGKFAPPKVTKTTNKPAGDYFKAYYDLVEQINPNPDLSKVITPHIDCWWHIVTKMPDLDDDYQKYQEDKIYAAFFWAVLCGYIYLSRSNPGKEEYKLDYKLLELENEPLIVSNGTVCDKLYEVLDAVAIYPELVTNILNRIDIKAQDDLNKGRPIEKGILFDSLANFYGDEPGLGTVDDHIGAKSIFSLPLLMKKSALPDLYYEEDVLTLVEVEIAEITKYISKFFNPDETRETVRNIIIDQFDKFLEDMEVESKTNKNIYYSTLFGHIGSIIIKALEDISYEDEAREMTQKIKDLTRKK